MTPPYKILNSSMSIVKSPKESYIEDFQQRLNEGFENSTDWFYVKEESPFGSENYVDVLARINYVVTAETGEKLSDDYKLLWFKDISHKVFLGTMFYFDNNYWITVNTESIKSLTTSITVKRCNNILRWFDSKGGIYTAPCTMGDSLIRENRDYATAGSAVVNMSGVLEIVTQFNMKTNTIKANQRFLFGNPDNWTCYKVFGAGVNNLNLMQTDNPYSAGLIRLTMGGSQYNEETDDLVVGIADYKQFTYAITTSVDSAYLNVGEKIKLDALVTLNNRSVMRDLVWTSDDESVVSITENDEILAKQLGNANVKVHLKNNTEVYAEVQIFVQDVPNYNWQILISPNSNYVLESDEKTFTVELLINNLVSSNPFTITIDPSTTVPVENYIFQQVADNQFKITNIKMYKNSPLYISCQNGTYIKLFPITLKGAW
jgi:hypothetical protein